MDKTDFQTNRRDFIKVLGSGLASVYLGGCAVAPTSLQRRTPGAYAAADKEGLFLYNHGPFDRTFDRLPQNTYSGDNPDRAHRFLWNKAQLLKSGKLPEPTESAEVVVVGGGMSGLISSYLLRDKNL